MSRIPPANKELLRHMMRNHTQAFFLLWHNLQPPHQVPPVSIHAALQTVLILQRRGSHTVNIMPPLELLARADVNTNATVSPPATKAIPTEPLLTYNTYWLIKSMAVLFFLMLFRSLPVLGFY